MLFRPKKVNRGFDRIFLVLAIIAGISFGFYAGLDRGASMTSESYKDYLPPDYLPPSFAFDWDSSSELRREWVKQWQAFEKAKPQALKRLRERKRQLESQGYRVSFMTKIHSRHGDELIPTYDGDPHVSAIWIYPSASSCIALGAIIAGISFLISLFSLRGIALLVFWIKQGFSEKE